MIPPKAIELIMKYEGCHLKAYRCPANILTIGWGSTENVKEGMVISQAEADKRLMDHVEKVNAQLQTLLNVPLASHQRAALLSFVYNLGVSSFRTSTLRKKINARDEAGIKEEWVRWTKSNGKDLPGLIARRNEELALFLTPTDLDTDLLPNGPTDDEISAQLEDVEQSVLK